MAYVAHRLLVVHIDRGHAGTAGVQRLDQRAALDQRRAAGVDQQRRRLHAPQIVCGHDPARRLDQPQVQVSTSQRSKNAALLGAAR